MNPNQPIIDAIDAQIDVLAAATAKLTAARALLTDDAPAPARRGPGRPPKPALVPTPVVTEPIEEGQN